MDVLVLNIKRLCHSTNAYSLKTLNTNFPIRNTTSNIYEESLEVLVCFQVPLRNRRTQVEERPALDIRQS